MRCHRWTIPLFLCICCLCAADVAAQDTNVDTIPKKDLIDVVIRLFHIHLPDSTRKKNPLIFSIIPIAPVNLGQKQAAVSAINLAFYAGNPATTNISSIYFVPYSNFADRSGIVITPNVWLGHNRWNLNGDWRLTNNANYTYGVGGNTPAKTKDIVDYRYIRFYANGNYKWQGQVNIGLGYNLDYYYQVADRMTNGYPDVFSIYKIGTGPQTTSSGITLNFLLDKRKNSINPSGGSYLSLSYRFNPSFLVNDYHWRSVYLDARKYIPLSPTRHSILGFWALYWGSYGDVPYLSLPGTALDAGGRTGRGYSLGRYRGKQLLYGESEYRFDLSRNGLWGGVVFINTQCYTQPLSESFTYLLPAAGTGIRLKFNKRSNMNITFDVAAGKNSFNWYLNLGEFF